MQQEGAGQAASDRDGSQARLSKARWYHSSPTQFVFGASPRQSCCSIFAQNRLTANWLFSINPNCLSLPSLGMEREGFFVAEAKQSCSGRGSEGDGVGSWQPQGEGLFRMLSPASAPGQSKLQEQTELTGFPGTPFAIRN